VKICIFFLFFFCLQAEKRLIVLITTYNNSKWCERNIRSVLSQEYDDFYVIVRDDASADNTFEKISKEVKRLKAEDKVYLHKNYRRRGKAANIWLTLHQIDHDVSIDDSDVIVICDGDDWYPHNNVFKHIDEVFSQNDVWITYGGFIEFPSGRKCWNRTMPQRIIQENKFREYGKNSSQQRCFYAGLYRKIKIEDLMFKSRFAQTAGDVAKAMPMLEMAAERHHLFTSSIYVYNRANQLNDDKVNFSFQFRTCRSFLREREKYHRRDSYLSEGRGVVETVLVASDRSKKEFSDILKKSSARYVLFLREGEQGPKNVDLNIIARYMDKTCAIRFDIRKNVNLKTRVSEPLGDGISCVQIGWNRRVNKDKFFGNVYSRNFVLEQIGALNFEKAQELFSLWESILFLNGRYRVALFFDK